MWTNRKGILESNRYIQVKRTKERYRKGGAADPAALEKGKWGKNDTMSSNRGFDFFGLRNQPEGHKTAF